MKINPIEWEIRRIHDVKKLVHADKAKVQCCECKLVQAGGKVYVKCDRAKRDAKTTE